MQNIQHIRMPGGKRRNRPPLAPLEMLIHHPRLGAMPGRHCSGMMIVTDPNGLPLIVMVSGKDEGATAVYNGLNAERARQTATQLNALADRLDREAGK